MSLIVSLIYLLLLPGVGACLLRQRELPFPYALLGASVLGAAISSVLFMSLTHLALLTAPIVAGASATLGLTSLYGWRHLLAHSGPPSGATLGTWWRGLDLWDRTLVAGCALCLLIYLLDAYTPPRSGDAMRYHLAQLEDLVRNGRFVFRPYYHYNFPLYFSYLSMPLYFAVGGMGVKLLNFLLLIQLAALTYALGRAAELARPGIPVLGLLLTPSILQAGTTVNNDLAMLCSALAGILLLFGYQRIPRKSFLALAFTGFGLAMGMKYQGVLFLPWYMALTWVAVGRKLSFDTAKTIACLGLIGALLPAPFFVRNYVNTGVPTWPLHQELFGGEQDYLYEVTTRHSEHLRGRHGLAQTGKAVKGIVANGNFLPLMWPLALLGGCVLFRRRGGSTQLRIGFGLVSFLVLWWLLQPNLYPRFINYALPQLMVLATVGAESLREGWLRRAGYAVATVCVVFGLAVMFYYSLDFFRFHLDQDVQRYHRFTWFYDDYSWIDEHLAPNARILVIANAGQTYYLNRDYVRADPYLTGTIDWRSMNAHGLREAVRELGTRYILFENRDWHKRLGGDELTQLMAEFSQTRDVELLWKRHVRLATSRVMRTFDNSEVWLLDVGSDQSTPAEPRP